MSTVEILTALYFHTMNVSPSEPNMPERDKFVLSKGHACSALYSALTVKGFFDKQYLIDNYTKNGSEFTGHINSFGVPGVEVSTGSLGHGLPFGMGFAYAAKLDSRKNRSFILMSDGECDEGSNWEAFLSAPHYKLGNLVAIIDHNKIQSYGTVEEVIPLGPLAKKLEAFNWEVKEVDGHSLEQLTQALDSFSYYGEQPHCIIAHTVKGKGVPTMENTLASHYWPLRDEEYAALMESCRR